MATIRELIYDKPLPLKIRCADLSSEWVMVTHANDHACLTIDSNDQHNSWLLSSENWELYNEPKKKVALYAFVRRGYWVQTDNYYADDEAFKYDYDTVVQFMRLPNTEIEANDE